MYRRIYKYSLGMVGSRHTVYIPKNSVPVKFEQQHGQFFLWVEVDTGVANEPEPFESVIVGTGWDVPDNERLQYFDTCFVDGYVWHLYLEMKNIF